MNTSRGEAERWLAWLDGDRKDDGTRPMVGTPYQTAQRIAARLYEAERERKIGVRDDEDGWRDYDHGFRDGYQAARREIAGPRYGTGGVIGTEEARRMSDSIAANEGLTGPQPIMPSPMVGELTGKTARERELDRARRWWWMTR